MHAAHLAQFLAQSKVLISGSYYYEKVSIMIQILTTVGPFIEFLLHTRLLTYMI